MINKMVNNVNIADKTTVYYCFIVNFNLSY